MGISDDSDILAGYVLDNPVRRGLVENWRDYPFPRAPSPSPQITFGEEQRQGAYETQGGVVFTV